MTPISRRNFLAGALGSLLAFVLPGRKATAGPWRRVVYHCSWEESDRFIAMLHGAYSIDDIQYGFPGKAPAGRWVRR